MSDAPGPEDILQQGPDQPRRRWFPGLDRLPGRNWRPGRGTALVAAVALLAGLGAGYATGRNQAGNQPASAAPRAAATPSGAGSASPFLVPEAVTQSGGLCSAQAGGRLQLGVQVTNEASVAVELEQASTMVPLGGLEQVSWQWATCGQRTGESGPNVVIILNSGESTWLTATFRVTKGCPAADPVQFNVHYVLGNHQQTASLPGFTDLGGVPYTGCAGR